MLRTISSRSVAVAKSSSLFTPRRHSSFLGLPIYQDPRETQRRKDNTPDPRFPAKLSTGVTGLAVIPNAREVYLKQVKKLVRELKINLPAESRFRWLYDRIYTFRLKVLEEEQDPRVIEKRLNSGQLEELIEEAHTILAMIPKVTHHTTRLLLLLLYLCAYYKPPMYLFKLIPIYLLF